MGSQIGEKRYRRDTITTTIHRLRSWHSEVSGILFSISTVKENEYTHAFFL